MNHKYTDTLIIGGGISGLSCARRLQEAGKNFIVVTKDIGGRIKASESFNANYGAAYMTTDYRHVLPFISKGEKMLLRDFYFFDGKTFSNFFSFSVIKHIRQLMILFWFTWRIHNHLTRYHKKAAYKSMRECFQEDPFLLKYWLMPANEFIKKYNLQEIGRYIVDPTTTATAFVGIKEVNTVYMLAMVFPAILKTWIIDFTSTIKKLTDGIRENILLGEVTKVKKNTSNGMYAINTSLGTITANNVVFAAPREQLKDVYLLPEQNIQQNCFVFHTSGVRKKKFSKKNIIFQDQYYDIHMLWRQRDGTDIIYTQSSNPDLKRYYDSYSLIRKIHWKPAMIIPICCILDQKIDENAYIASDFNVSGLEDAFLSGQYAANQIIMSSTRKKNVARNSSRQNKKNSLNTKIVHAMTKDPVCDMDIQTNKALLIKYKGRNYFFCGSSCRSLFEYNPEQFIIK